MATDTRIDKGSPTFLLTRWFVADRKCFVNSTVVGHRVAFAILCLEHVVAGRRGGGRSPELLLIVVTG